MEKKNTILLTVIAVATLLVAVVGATFAYFTATSSSQGDTATSDVTTAQIASLNVTSTASEKSYLEYPGGIAVLGAGVKIDKEAVSAGSTSTVDYDVTLSYTNNTSTDLTYSIYRKEATGEDSLALAAMDAGCRLQVTPSAGADQYAYTCTGSKDSLAAAFGDAGATGTLTKNTSEEQTITVDDETFTYNSEDAVNASYYYYVIIEYPNKGEQNADMGKDITISLDVSKATVSTTADSN